jgi:hypothetical protein
MSDVSVAKPKGLHEHRATLLAIKWLACTSRPPSC